MISYFLHIPNRLFFVVAGGVLLLATLAFVRVPAGGALFRRGLQARQTWQLDRAVNYFAWAARLRPDDARARFEQGLSLQLRGDFLASQREFESLAQTPDPALQAELLNALGVNHFNFNEPDRALELHRQSLELARQLADRRLQAQALINLGRVLYHSKGDGAQALEYLEQALRLARETHDELSQADALRNLGAVYWWHKGERERPLHEFYLPALALYQRHNDQRGAAIALSNISLVHWFRGDALQFLKYQSESLAIKERIGDRAGLSDSYLYLSWFYIRLQNHRKAREYQLHSLELSQAIGYRLGQNDAEGSLAGVYLELREFDNAIGLLQRLLERERANPLLLKYRLSGLGVCHRLKGEPIAARQYFEQALELNRQAGRESEVNLLTQIGETYQDAGDWPRAAEYLARAEEAGWREKEKNWWHWLLNRRALARQMERQGRRDAALAYLLEAAEIETLLAGADGEAPSPGQVRQVYDEAFALLLAAPDANAEKEAFRLLEQLRYRAFRNLLVRVSDPPPASPSLARQERAALARLRQVAAETGDPERLRRAYAGYENAALNTQLDAAQYSLARAAKAAAPEDVQRALDAETAVIEYLYADEKVFALVVTRAGLRSVALPVTRANLAAKVKLLRARLSEAEDTNDWQPVAEDLRGVLLAPLEQAGALSGVRRLGLVPFGFLHDLPFAALARRGDDGGQRFLVEDYTLFHLPAAGFLTQPARPAPAPTLLSFGHNAADADEPPLRFAEAEAAAVAALYGGTTRLRAAAAETELKRLAPQFKYIHLATHAVSEPTMPLLSRLTLHGTAEDDGQLTVREIFNLQLNADLVTLGACRTGQSFASSGNQSSEVDRLGLREAFLHAGARRVVATLWPVADQPTMELMRAFYARLRAQHDPADALAATQRAALRGQLSSETNPLTHPRHWAAFTLTGN